MPPSQPPRPKPPGEQALSELRKALLEEAQQSTQIYLNEWKKLLVALSEAFQGAGELRQRGREVDPEGIFRRELHHQLMAFALMRLVGEEESRRAAQEAQESGSGSLSARLVQRLESRVEVTPQTEQAMTEGLYLQPLFRLLGAQPELFVRLGAHLSEIAARVPQMLNDANQALRTAQMQRPPYQI